MTTFLIAVKATFDSHVQPPASFGPALKRIGEELRLDVRPFLGDGQAAGSHFIVACTVSLDATDDVASAQPLLILMDALEGAMDEAGSSHVQLTVTPLYDAAPAWWPDDSED